MRFLRAFRASSPTASAAAPAQQALPLRRFLSAMALLVAFAATSAGARAQSLVNGGSVAGTIAPAGDVDTYSFHANAGEAFQIRVTDSLGEQLYPIVTLYDPSGAYVDYGGGYDVAALSETASMTGTFTIQVSDGTTQQAQTGPYQVHFVRMPGANEHGMLTNGGSVLQSIDKGDLDSWTFSGAAGQQVQLRLVDIAATGLYPIIALYGPTGAYIDYGGGYDVAALNLSLPSNGTYTVLVYDGTNSHAQVGDYELHFAHLPEADEHGTLVNGGFVRETIARGDLDSWTFSGDAGQRVQLRLVDTAATGLYPIVALYGPTGNYIDYGGGYDVAGLNLSLPTSGTYTVLVYDGTNGHAQTGDYELHFAHLPEANEHGPLVNGGKVQETVTRGDLDSWTFSGQAGQHVQLRLVDSAATGLYPIVALYGPTGNYIDYGGGYDVAALSLGLPETGEYTVLVYDGTNGKAETGDYELHFIKAPGAQEHGALIDGTTTSEFIERGDLDSYTFSAIFGATIRLEVEDVDETSLYPIVVAYRPDGSYLGYGGGYTTATLQFQAPVTGSYTVVVYDGTNGKQHMGAYNLSFEGGTGAMETFCQTSPNSVDATGASIAAQGSASIAANDLVLTASPLPANQPGIFYYGPQEVNVAFGDGRRCVGGQVVRLPVVYADAAGQLRFEVDNTALPPLGQFVAGATWKFQSWYRDPAAGGSGFNLSNGLSVTLAP